MAPLLSPKHGARNDRPLSGDMHGGDRGCPVTRDGRTRPRQGREGLGPGRVRRTPRGRTARTRLWALTLDRGVPSPAPGGKVTHSLHGRLCSADAQGEGAAGREGPRPPARSCAELPWWARSRAQTRLGPQAPGARPGPPRVAGHDNRLGAPGQAVCPRRLRGAARKGRQGADTPDCPLQACARIRAGQKGLPGSGVSRGQSRRLSHPRPPPRFLPQRPQEARDSAGSHVQREGEDGGTAEGRHMPCTDPGWWSEAGAPGGLPHATLTSVPGHTHARPLRG